MQGGGCQRILPLLSISITITGVNNEFLLFMAKLSPARCFMISTSHSVIKARNGKLTGTGKAKCTVSKKCFSDNVVTLAV